MSDMKCWNPKRSSWKSKKGRRTDIEGLSLAVKRLNFNVWVGKTVKGVTIAC